MAGETGVPVQLVNMARRLVEALERPITGEIWPGLIETALDRFGDVPVLIAFAEKALETLADDERHDRVAVSPDEPQVAIWFVAWSGTHREVQSQRYGEYLSRMFAIARNLSQRGVELAAFIELDAYLHGHGGVSPAAADGLAVDVEVSFLPGRLLGYPVKKPNPFPEVVRLNPDLCTPEEQVSLQAAARG